MGVYFYPHLFDAGAFAAEVSTEDVARLDRIAAAATIDTEPGGLPENDRELVDGIVAAVALAEVGLDDEARVFADWEGSWDVFGRVRGDLHDGDELDTVLAGAHRLFLTATGIEGFLLPDEIGRAIDLLRVRGATDENSVTLLDLLETADRTGRGLAWWWV